MKFTLMLAIAGAALAAPVVTKRQTPCFLIGTEELPEEVSAIADSLANSVTCNIGRTTISNVPDVISGGISFSSINFADSDQSPLAFSLGEFATTSPLAKNDLNRFQNELNAYLATEAGIRSVGGSLDIKVPKFFLQFQIARIQRAQGNVPEMPGMDVQHQLDKVLKNAAGENQDLLDEVNDLAITYD
ncbi:Fc.00g038470.m01.CDS01 [Cosmosporella sp. VM-42]